MESEYKNQIQDPTKEGTVRDAELYSNFKTIAESIPETPVLLYNDSGRPGQAGLCKNHDRSWSAVNHITQGGLFHESDSAKGCRCQLEIAAEVDTLAEKRYKTSIETFMIGKIDILDLNDAQSSKDDAKQKHIQELYYYWRYFYNIRSITLYDFLNNRTLDADFEEIVKR